MVLFVSTSLGKQCASFRSATQRRPKGSDVSIVDRKTEFPHFATYCSCEANKAASEVKNLLN